MLPGPSGTVSPKGIDEPELVIYHQKSLTGFLSSVHLIPRTSTVTVVLTNSLAKKDTADWLGQLIVETVLDNPEKNDYVMLARESAERPKAL